MDPITDSRKFKRVVTWIFKRVGGPYLQSQVRLRDAVNNVSVATIASCCHVNRLTSRSIISFDQLVLPNTSAVIDLNNHILAVTRERGN